MNVCCISVTLAARMIGALGLSISILMINVLISDFFGREADRSFYDTIEVWAVFGLNWTRFIKNAEIPEHARTILLCFICYSLIFLITSGLMAIGTVMRKPNCALPWLYFQMLCIADQMVFLAIHLTHPPGYDAVGRSNWYIPVCCIYLLISLYFWSVVFSAREDWIARPERHGTFDVFNQMANETIRDSNVPKTPSFLAQNYCFQEHLPPIQPVKYISV